MAVDDGIERRGLMLVLSGPSGVGVTTLSRLLIERIGGLRLSVSVTTRAMRPSEVDGRDYHFVPRAAFEDMVNRQELLEWATVFDNRYGTPRAPVEAALSAGEDVLFDIDWQGAQQLREKARQDVVSIFILPPSTADLQKRLYARAQDSNEVIRKRMNGASREMSHWAQYDYIIVNRNLDEAFAEVQSILRGERLKRERRVGLTNEVRALLAALEQDTKSTPDLSAINVAAVGTVGTLTADVSSGDEGTDVTPLSARSQAIVAGGVLPVSEFRGDVSQGAAPTRADTTQLRVDAFESLRARVAVLEAVLANRPAGVGHNRGPDIDDELSVDEAEIRTFISRLQDQRATAPVDLPKLIEAAQVADPAVNKWRERTDEFAKGVLKGAGFAAGKVAVEKLAQAAWVQSVYSALQAVFESLVRWLDLF